MALKFVEGLFSEKPPVFKPAASSLEVSLIGLSCVELAMLLTSVMSLCNPEGRPSANLAYILSIFSRLVFKEFLAALLLPSGGQQKFRLKKQHILGNFVH